MKKVLSCLAVLSVAVMFSQLVFAQGAGESPGEWLSVGVGARATAMGESYVAIGNDASAIFWNPAGLVGSHKTEFMFQYGMLPAGIGYHAVALCIPIGGKSESATAYGMPAPVAAYSPYERYAPQYYGAPAKSSKKGLGGAAIGLGMSYLTSGDMDMTDSGGGGSGETFAVNYMAAMLSFSTALGEAIGLGATGKMINESVGDTTASTIGVDAGVLFSAKGNLSLGASIQNLGATLGDTAVPQTMRAGIGISGGPLTISADMNMVGSDSRMSAGVEMNLGGLALRGGYIMGMDETTMGKGAILSPGMSLGFGVDTESLCLDLALVDVGDMGYEASPLNTPVRASLAFKF
jgi:hypothetical protein